MIYMYKVNNSHELHVLRPREFVLCFLYTIIFFLLKFVYTHDLKILKIFIKFCIDNTHIVQVFISCGVCCANLVSVPPGGSSLR